MPSIHEVSADVNKDSGFAAKNMTTIDCKACVKEILPLNAEWMWDEQYPDSTSIEGFSLLG